MERWYGVETAGIINLWLLAIVAGWRVTMFVKFLRRGIGFSPGLVFTAALLPLMGIVSTLAILNLDRVVFQFMAFGDSPPPTSNDDAFGILMLLTGLSYLAIIPILAIYLIQVATAWAAATEARQKAAAVGETSAER